MVLQKIISGGQTGADRGALDGARSCGFSYGGAIPAGRKTEAGPLPDQYVMEELVSDHYPVRTRKNIEDGDGTLIVSHGPLTGGSLLTQQIARASDKPCIHIDFDSVDFTSASKRIKNWLESYHVKILNVAGPRASSDPTIYELTRRLIISLLPEDHCNE